MSTRWCLLLLPLVFSSVPALRLALQPSLRTPPPCMSGVDDSPAAVCAALQGGQSPEGLSSVLSTTSGARKFFKEYLGGKDWTCADAAEPPKALIDSLADSPQPVVDVVLLNVLAGAATSSELTCTRARTLTNALWSELPSLQESCLALGDAVSMAMGEAVPVVWDANYEVLKDDWAGILAVVSYDREQLRRGRAALRLCGKDEEGGVVVPTEL